MKARKENIAFANTLPDVIQKLKEMNLAQAQGVRADTVSSIKAQKEAIEDLESSISSLESEHEKYSTLAKQFGVTEDKNNGYVIKAENAANELAKKRRDLSGATATLQQTEAALHQINVQVNQGIVAQMKAARDNALAIAEAEKQASFLGGTQAFLAAKLGQTTEKFKEFNSEALKIDWGGKEGEKLIKQAERRLALSKLEGEARARQQAAYDAEDAGTVDSLAIEKLQDTYAATERVTQAKKDQNKEDKAATSEAKKSASAAESIAQKLANLEQQSELAAGSTQDLSKEQAILRAQQSLGAAATQKDIDLAGKYAEKIWQTTAALKAQNAVPELKENASYNTQKAALESLKGQTDANGQLLLSQEQYSRESERIEQEHQANLAKIKAGQVVTPQQQAVGSVDPVQQLANENAQKLALIQQFEANKTLTEQQGLMLRNAANMEYEQQRQEAMWTLWKNQSEGNQILAAGFESLAGNASNAFTGIITGSMTAEDAMNSLVSNALNSLINGFVQMGVEWIKSAVTGSAAQVAATATTTAAAVAGTATTTAASTTAAAATTTAWTPAAIVASIGSFGGAAAIGIGAVIAAMALSSSLAGKRKNGGPVSAGSMYQVGEGGMPEIYQASSGKQFMIPGDNGKVISNKDMQSGSGGGGGGGVVVNINNYTSSTVDAQATPDGKGGWTVDAFVYDISNGGPASQAIEQYHQAPRKARG